MYRSAVKNTCRTVVRTVVTVVMMVRRADWLSEWFTRASKVVFYSIRARFSRMRS